MREREVQFLLSHCALHRLFWTVIISKPILSNRIVDDNALRVKNGWISSISKLERLPELEDRNLLRWCCLITFERRVVGK